MLLRAWGFESLQPHQVDSGPAGFRGARIAFMTWNHDRLHARTQDDPQVTQDDAHRTQDDPQGTPDPVIAIGSTEGAAKDFSG